MVGADAEHDPPPKRTLHATPQDDRDPRDRKTRAISDAELPGRRVCLADARDRARQYVVGMTGFWICGYALMFGGVGPMAAPFAVVGKV